MARQPPASLAVVIVSRHATKQLTSGHARTFQLACWRLQAERLLRAQQLTQTMDHLPPAIEPSNNRFSRGLIFGGNLEKKVKYGKNVEPVEQL